MALKVFFGNGGSSGQHALSNTDPYYVGDALALGSGPLSETARESGELVGGQIDGRSVAVSPVASAESGLGGNVDISYSNAGYEFSASGEWNSVKNALASSDSSGHLTFHNFVHVDVALAGSSASSVVIEDAKRGNVSTGAGNDSVDISLTSNGAGWTNSFAIRTGAGNDSVVLHSGTAHGNAAVVDGSLTTVSIDTGRGNDTVDLSDLHLLSARIEGGAGNDIMTGSTGADTFVYGAAKAGFDIITNFDALQDHLELAAGVTVRATHSMDDSLLISLSNGTLLSLEGVTAFQHDWIL